MGVLADWQIKDHVKITPYEPSLKRPGVISYGSTSYGYDFRVGPLWKVFNPNKLLNNPTGPKVIDPKTFDSDCLDVVNLAPIGHKWGVEFTSMREPRYWVCSTCKERREALDMKSPAFEVCPKAEQPPDHVIIPPHSFALCETVETVEIPRDCLCVVVGKSTYARCGILVLCTPLEPEWRGKVTVEVANTTPLPAKVYVNEGIMQGMFFRTDGVGEALLNAMRSLVSPNNTHDAGYLQWLEERFHKELGSSTCKISYQDKKGIYQDQSGLTLPTVGKEEGP